MTRGKPSLPPGLSSNEAISELLVSLGQCAATAGMALIALGEALDVAARGPRGGERAWTEGQEMAWTRHERDTPSETPRAKKPRPSSKGRGSQRSG